MMAWWYDGVAVLQKLLFYECVVVWRLPKLVFYECFVVWRLRKLVFYECFVVWNALGGSGGLSGGSWELLGYLELGINFL